MNQLALEHHLGQSIMRPAPEPPPSRDLEHNEPCGEDLSGLGLYDSQCLLKRHALRACPWEGILFHPREPTARPSGLFPRRRRYALNRLGSWQLRLSKLQVAQNLIWTSLVGKRPKSNGGLALSTGCASIPRVSGRTGWIVQHGAARTPGERCGTATPNGLALSRGKRTPCETLSL
jgi:hypothetical protein